MSPASAAQLAFAAEFAVFLVTLAGFASALRQDLLADRSWARSALASGFLALATASFLRGALVVADAGTSLLLALRFGGIALVAVGALRWSVGAKGRVAVWSGLLVLTAATVADIQGRAELADGLRIAGAALLAGALVFAARRSISARIGVNAAVLLLVVVLGVSLTVSVVVSRNVEDEAVRRYSARATNEASAVIDTARGALTPAKLVAGSIVSARAVQLVAFVDRATPAVRASARAAVVTALEELTSDRLLAIHDPVLFISPSGAPEAAVPGTLENTTRLALAGDPVVVDARRAHAARQAVVVVRGRAYAVGAVPMFVRRSGRPLEFAGLIVVARRFDDTYLRVLGRAGEPLSFALATPSTVLARAGREPSHRVLTQAARRAAEQPGSATSSQQGKRFVVAAPVAVAGQPPVLSFVVSVPSAAIDATREALFRNLFAVALGATVVALVLAAALGERIGSGLRRLTRATERFRGGDFDAPVDVGPDDELGALGSAFTSMAGSIQTMTGELRQAAVDESRLRGRMEAVVAGMGEALVAVGPDGQVVELNRAASELFGTERSAALGRPLGEVVRPVDESAAIRQLNVDIASGILRARRSFEVDLVGADGGAVPVSLTVGALSGPEGEPAGAVFLARDLRQEHEVETMKTEFLANIGHELRSPLTPIKGYADVLARRTVPPEQTRKYALQIVGGVDQLERVVGQLVNFATIAAGRLALDLEPVDPQGLIDSAAARWRQRLDDRHDVIVDPVSEGVGPLVIDRTYLDQALDELVDNAIKYSPKGGTVRLSVVRSEDVDVLPMVELVVSDEGLGIPPDKLSGLLADFSQGDASATRRFGGLGLGLALADRIVRTHGGRLRFRSKVDSGTRVSILLPVDSRNGGGPGGAEPGPLPNLS